MENINSVEEYNQNKGNGSISVFDFYADWCGPCKVIEPHLERLNEEYENVNVYKINIDENPELAKEHNVRSIPTIKFYNEDASLEKQSLGSISFKNLQEMVESISE